MLKLLDLQPLTAYSYRFIVWQLSVRPGCHSCSPFGRSMVILRATMCRRAARRGQGGRLTTLNFRPGAVTTLYFFHVLIFLSSNISRKQTRQYRKPTKEATSGNGYIHAKEREREREEQTIVAKNQLVKFQAVIGAHCKKFTGSVDGDPETWFSKDCCQNAFASGSLPWAPLEGGLTAPPHPSWKRLGHTPGLTTLFKNRSRATDYVVSLNEVCLNR